MNKFRKALMRLEDVLRNNMLGIEAHLRKMNKAVNNFEEETVDKLSLYKRYRPFMKEGDPIQMHSYSGLGWLIRYFSSPGILKNTAIINHTSTLKKESYEGVKHRRWILEALAKGPEYNLLSERLEEYNGKVYWLPVRDVFDSWRGAVMAWQVLQVNKGYDYESLFKQAVTKVSADARALYCSEYWCMGWEHALKVWLLKHRPSSAGLLKAQNVFGVRLCNGYEMPSGQVIDPAKVQVLEPFGMKHVPKPDELPQVNIFKRKLKPTDFEENSPIPDVPIPEGSHGILIYDSKRR